MTEDDVTFLQSLSDRMCGAADVAATAPVPAERYGRRKPCPGCADPCGQCGDEALD